MAKKAAPDFGKGGKLKVRADEQGAVVQVSKGELLRLTLTANGPGKAVFSFGCQHKTHWSSRDWEKPQKVYEWKHFDQPSDADATSDSYALSMAFIGGITSYTFLMEQITSTGAVVATLKDFDASSNVADDLFVTGITLFVD